MHSAPAEQPTDDRRTFRLAFAPGVTPARWVSVWRERLPDVALELVAVGALDRGETLRSGGAEAGLLRLPVDRDELNAIPLYTEVPVVVVGKEHAIAAFDEIVVGDLDDEVVLRPLDDPLEWDQAPGQPALERPATTADAIELVAAGIGVLVLPQSVARLHHRKDVTYRPVTDGPTSGVGLVWPGEDTSDLVEEMVGIVRGRTANSSRGRSSDTAAPAEAVATQKGRADGSQKGRRQAPSKAELKAAAARTAADRRAAFERKTAAKTGARRGGKHGPSGGKRGQR